MDATLTDYGWPILSFVSIINILLPIEVADVPIGVTFSKEWTLCLFFGVLLLVLHFVFHVLMPPGPRLIVIRVLGGFLMAVLAITESALARVILARLALVTTT